MLTINGFVPKEGWPGTIITIHGTGFSSDRDSNVATIGGEPALIIEADPTRLVVMAGEATVGGDLEVDVPGDTANAGEFRVLDHPSLTDITASGPPRFFHGPYRGTPTTNIAHQGVQVVFAHTSSDTPPANARIDEIAKIEKARQWWDQASYGSTTWDMRYSDWVALPKDHRFYFWGQADIDDARRALLHVSNKPLTRDGTSIIRGASASFIPITHPTPLSWSFGLGLTGDGTPMWGLRRIGNRLYGCTKGGSVFIYDVTNPTAAVKLGSVNVAGAELWDIDILGDRALVAMGERGVGLLDISNSAAPRVIEGVISTATTPDWRTVIRVAGGQFVAGAGKHLRVYHLVADDIQNLADIAVPGWITDIAIEGTTCAVATDDKGLFLFELTAGGALARGSLQSTTRIRSIKLVGGIAFLAAYDTGVVAVDCTNIDAPTKLGEKSTAVPAYNLVVSGTELVVATGDSVLISIDASNPTAMAIVGGQPISGYEPPLADFRGNLSTALDKHLQVKGRDRLMIDALRAYFAAIGRGPDVLDDVEGIIVVTDPPVRAFSGITQAMEFRDGPDFVPLNELKGAFYHNYSNDPVDWTVYTHELCHWLGVKDTYSEEYADGSVVVGTAAEWCLSGNGLRASLFSGHWMHSVLDWYRFDGTPDSNVLEKTWSPSAIVDEHFEIVAHGAGQDNKADRYHAIRLIVSTGQSYYIEVRQQKPPGLLFDQQLDLMDGDKGRVLITRVKERQGLSNTFERDVQLVDALTVGGQVADAARNLMITVEEKTADDPLAFRVRVEWNAPIAGDPNGTFDLTITPWDTKTWISPDIWVKSLRGAPPTPPGISDRPWVKHNNKVHARIRNTGPSKVDEAWVSCYITSPPGIGDNGSWQLLGTQHVTDIDGHGEKIITFDWTPEVAGHTCISIAILPKIGEINTDNNRAQTNVATFDSGSASSHQPVVLEAFVRSPFSIWKKVDLYVHQLPKGWHAVVDRAWVWLAGKGEMRLRTVIYNDIQTPWGEGRGIEHLALPTIDGWTDYQDRYEPIGGILAPVRAVKKVQVELRLEAGGGQIYIWGGLTPAVANVPITAEVVDERGRQFLCYGKTAGNGRYEIRTGASGHILDPGRYSVQTFTAAGGDAAESESPVVIATVH